MCGGGACMVGGMGDVHGGGHAWWGVCMAGDMATEADGTHPTGIHSRLIAIYVFFVFVSEL